MPNPDPKELANGREARLIAIVLVVTMGLWLGGQWLGGAMGWQTRFAFLFDFAALAAFLWSMVATWRIWRRRADNRTDE
jgi:hypothetical protein